MLACGINNDAFYLSEPHPRSPRDPANRFGAEGCMQMGEKWSLVGAFG